METEASKLGLHISWSKTKVQNIGFGPACPPLHLGFETVESVESFCYLGSNILNMANSREESIRRMGIASTALQRLGRIWKQRRLSIETKFRLYKCLVLSVLLYGSETWAMTKKDWMRLEAFHTKAQRRILGIKWSDFTTNVELYQLSGLETLHDMIRRRRLGLFGHVARLPTDVPASAALQLAAAVRDGDPSCTGWSRPRGRPPTTWCHHIHDDCGLPPLEALHSAQDRTLWREIVTANKATRDD